MDQWQHYLYHVKNRRRPYVLLSNMISFFTFLPLTEDVGCWKLAAQYIQRELKEADEVNLLDEEGKISDSLFGVAKYFILTYVSIICGVTEPILLILSICFFGWVL